MKIIWRNNLISLWYRLFRSKSKITKLIRIGAGGKGISSLLFILPSEKRFAQNASHFIKSVDNKEDLDVFYLIHQKATYLYSEIISSKIISFSDEDFNFLGIFKNRDIIKKIKSLGFDAVVDLNLSEKQTISFLMLELPSPIKVGFESVFSNKIYSIIIKPSPTGFLEKSFENVEKILGLK